MLNILEIIVEIISGSLGSDTLSAIATVTEIPVSTLRISLAVSVIILAIEIIIKLFLGIKACPQLMVTLSAKHPSFWSKSALF